MAGEVPTEMLGRPLLVYFPVLWFACLVNNSLLQAILHKSLKTADFLTTEVDKYDIKYLPLLR